MAGEPVKRRASVLTRAAFGLDAHPVHVECHLAGGLPGTTVVGLAEGAVKEARDRVKVPFATAVFIIQPVISPNLAPHSIYRLPLPISRPANRSPLTH